MNKISNTIKEISNKLFNIDENIVELGDSILYFIIIIQEEFKKDPRLLTRVIKLINEDYKFVKYPVSVNERGDIYFLLDNKKYLINTSKNIDIKKSDAKRIGALALNMHLNANPNVLDLLNNFKDIIIKEKSKLETQDKIKY
jgi:hypothetical protein